MKTEVNEVIYVMEEGLALATVILAVCLGIGGCDVLCHLDEIVWAAQE